MPLKTRLLLLAFLLLLPFTTAVAQRSLIPDERSVHYGGEDDRDRVADIFLPPDAEPPYPVVLMFHGSPGNKADMENGGIPQIVVAEGYAAVAVEYTTRLPEAYADALCALAWLHAEADTYDLDSSRVAAFGLSFGGLPTAMLAAIDDPAVFMTDCPYTLPDDFRLSGVIGDAARLVASVDDVLTSLEGGDLEAYQDVIRETPPADWRDLDVPQLVIDVLRLFPIYWVNGGEPPHLLIHGLGDSVVPYQEAFDYAAALTAHNVSVQMLLVRLTGHVPAPYLYDREMATFLHRIFD